MYRKYSGPAPLPMLCRVSRFCRRDTPMPRRFSRFRRRDAPLSPRLPGRRHGRPSPERSSWILRPEKAAFRRCQSSADNPRFRSAPYSFCFRIHRNHTPGNPERSPAPIPETESPPSPNSVSWGLQGVYPDDPSASPPAFPASPKGAPPQKQAAAHLSCQCTGSPYVPLFCRAGS